MEVILHKLSNKIRQFFLLHEENKKKGILKLKKFNNSQANDMISSTK